MKEVKQIVYKCFKYNHYIENIEMTNEVIDGIMNINDNDYTELHKLLESYESSKLGGKASSINRCINACKIDLKNIRKIIKSDNDTNLGNSISEIAFKMFKYDDLLYEHTTDKEVSELLSNIKNKKGIGNIYDYIKRKDVLYRYNKSIDYLKHLQNIQK